MVAPAGPPPADRLEAGLRILDGWGLRVVRGEHLLDRHPTLGYLAGHDRDRAADLQAAWTDPRIAAVFCARGGYGSLRTVEHVDWAAMAAAPPKLLVGSSDITVLHSLVGARCQVVTLFAPMPATAAFVDDPVSAQRLRRMLFHPDGELVLRGPAAETLVGGRAQGPTAGGNLSLIVSQLGVPGSQPPAGAIALIEDVGEDPYRIDHMVTHLLHAGWFAGVAGIALGSWDGCGGDPAAVRAVMADRLGGLGVPVVWEHGFGHGPGQLTVPLGVPAVLDADAGSITLLETPLAE